MLVLLGRHLRAPSSTPAVCGGAWRRWLASVRGGSVPLIGKVCQTARKVLEVHEKHASAMKPIDVSSCWNTLGKLVARDLERRWLNDALQRRKVTAPVATVAQP